MAMEVPEGCKSFDRTELQKCVVCGKGMMHNRDIIFYEVSIGQVFVDHRAIQQIAGLEMQMGGNAALAAMFASTSQVGVRLPPSRMLVCSPCFMAEVVGERTLTLPELWERANKQSKVAQEEGGG